MTIDKEATKPPRWMGTNHPLTSTEERLLSRYEELVYLQYSGHEAIFKIMAEELDRLELPPISGAVSCKGTEYVMVRADVVAFLRGEGALDGHWFGDTIPDGEKKPYWWRRYLAHPMTRTLAISVNSR